VYVLVICVCSFMCAQVGVERDEAGSGQGWRSGWGRVEGGWVGRYVDSQKIQYVHMCKKVIGFRSIVLGSWIELCVCIWFHGIRYIIMGPRI